MSDVSEKIKNGFYTKTSVEVSYSCNHKCLKCGKLVYCLAGDEEDLNFCPKCGNPHSAEKALKEHGLLVSKQDKQLDALFIQFKTDLFEELRISGHPKKEIIFDFAESLYKIEDRDLRHIFNNIGHVVEFTELYDE